MHILVTSCQTFFQILLTIYICMIFFQNDSNSFGYVMIVLRFFTITGKHVSLKYFFIFPPENCIFPGVVSHPVYEVVWGTLCLVVPILCICRKDSLTPPWSDQISFICGLTLNVQEPSYLGFISSIPWLLMPWLLASPGHQQPWYWLYRIVRSLSYLRKDFNFLYHVIVEEWH